MTSLEEIGQPSDCSLTHTLLAYWRKLLTEFSEVRLLGILGSSPFGDSRKFMSGAFRSVGQDGALQRQRVS
jgi:hypothetical protein